ncbi:MFS transporter [Nocardioides sp. cx-169]|uniref:MFS transporter n=1 Tax=Nocardioides sp. cx-169 TaxID=2899080 RepID=UPI001E64411F|nr:MFS transporter [Nocardioides sp. cx-169]MCD4536183.1 MFS transporter [Nocardioides sp. cx-169]
MSPTFRSLRNPNYRLYAVGNLVSNVGTWMQRVAQDWLVLLLTANSAAAIGITTGLQFLPFLLLSPVAGLVADRIPKRRLLQMTNIGMAAPALVLGVLAITGTVQIWHVYVLALVLGVASAFDAPARQSFVSEIVDADDLTNAVGLNSAGFNSARLLGPALAGVSIALLGSGVVATGWVILLNAFTYIGPIVALARLDGSTLHVADLVRRQPGQIRAGVSYVRQRPDLMLILGIVFFAGTFGLNFQMTSALMATQVFDKGSAEFGMLGTFLAVGSLTGSLLAASRERVRHRLVVGAAVVFGLVEIVAGLAPSYLTFALLCPVLGFLALTMVTSANAFMQLNTDAGMRGRVMALYMMIFIGGTPLGAPVLGWVGEVFGARWTLIGGGAMTVAGVLFASAVYLRAKAHREGRPARDLVHA